MWQVLKRIIVIIKFDRKLLQNVAESYYNVWQTGIRKCPKKYRYYIVWNKVITKFDSYYKLRQLLQSKT